MSNENKNCEKPTNKVLDFLNVYCPGLLGFIDSKIGTRLLKTSTFFGSSPLLGQELDFTRDTSKPRKGINL